MKLTGDVMHIGRELDHLFPHLLNLFPDLARRGFKLTFKLSGLDGQDGQPLSQIIVQFPSETPPLFFLHGEQSVGEHTKGLVTLRQTRFGFLSFCDITITRPKTQKRTFFAAHGPARMLDPADVTVFGANPKLDFLQFGICKGLCAMPLPNVSIQSQNDFG
jgi:hypothetical protein